MEEVAELTAEKTVMQVFIKLGVDITDPIEMQRDFSHLRKHRQSTEAITMKMWLTAAGVVVTGILAAVWLAVRGSH